MNWMFTRANTRIRFERDEPFCHVFPIGRSSIESVRSRAFWHCPKTPTSSGGTNTGRKIAMPSMRPWPIRKSPAALERWQKMYFHGLRIRTEHPHPQKIIAAACG